MVLDGFDHDGVLQVMTCIWRADAGMRDVAIARDPFVSTTTTRFFRSSASTRDLAQQRRLADAGPAEQRMLFLDSTTSRTISIIPYIARPTRR